MALPVAPPPKPNDVVVLGWAGLTVRVAWTLLTAGVRIRPDVLREARMHVLYHIDPTVPLAHAEDIATRLTEEFITRARGQISSDPWVADWEMPLTQRWRRALDKSLDDISTVVFHKHYGDGRSLAKIEEQTGVDRTALEAARNGLREVVRGIGVADGLPLDSWSTERIDRLLGRIVAHAPGTCPPPLDIAMGSHVEHVQECPRCDRLTRLVRSNTIEVDDLFAPTVGARPTARTRVLAIQLHPDARKARKLIVESLTGPAFPLGDDLLLLDATDLVAPLSVLRMAAEVACPPREHLRGVVIEGLGAWTAHGLVGPLADKAVREVLLRSWGTVVTIGPSHGQGPGPAFDIEELPQVLPEPPSARGMWFAVALLAALLVAIITLATRPQVHSRSPDVSAEFTRGRGGLWVAFDVPEPSLVLLVYESEGALWPALSSSSAADKARYATGDGSYRVFVPGDGALLLATDRPVEGAQLEEALTESSASEQPLSALEERLGPLGHVLSGP